MIRVIEHFICDSCGMGYEETSSDWRVKSLVRIHSVPDGWLEYEDERGGTIVYRIFCKNCRKQIDNVIEKLVEKPTQI